MGKVTAARAAGTASIAIAPRTSANRPARGAGRKRFAAAKEDAPSIVFVFMSISRLGTGCFKVAEAPYARLRRRRRMSDPAPMASRRAEEGSGIANCTIRLLKSSAT